MHLVGFAIDVYCDVQPFGRQISSVLPYRLAQTCYYLSTV